MKIYFDNCSLQRPLDSKSQVRIAVEAEAVLGLLAMCESGQEELISSDILAFEVSRNLNIDRVNWALGVLHSSRTHVHLTDSIESLARSFEEQGIRPLDALHLASADQAQADYFCTCDDQILRRARSIVGLNIRVASPLELASEIGEL